MRKNERFQSIWHLYESEHGYAPATAKDAAAWGIAQGLLKEPKPISGLDILAGQMASALREEYDTHKGYRYRVNHAVRVSKDGEQQTFWAVMGYAAHAFMEKAFAQRREHIIGECVQLNTDVTVYNDLNAGKNPKIQMVLDFTDDVAERQQGGG
jgi:hypothetical protein